VPKEVTTKVHNGLITLEGEITWHFQRDSAERAVRNLTGVTSVLNLTTIKPETSVAQVKEKVEAALQRQAKAARNRFASTCQAGWSRSRAMPRPGNPSKTLRTPLGQPRA
jgi:osmotically-inducible protein OsmY